MPKSTTDHDDKEARAYNWVLLATFILLISLIIQTPARMIGHFLPAGVRPMLTAWGGSIWSGQVNGQVKGVSGQLRWQARPLALFGLKLGTGWQLLTGRSEVHGEYRKGAGGWQLRQIQGRLAAADLQTQLSGWQLPDAPLDIQQLDLVRQGDSWQDSAGRISWQGGPVDYVFNGQRQHVNLPPVILSVQGQQGSLTIQLREQQGGGNLATFIVTGDRLESRLTQRLLMYSPGYHGVAEPDAVVVTATQPVSSL